MNAISDDIHAVEDFFNEKKLFIRHEMRVPVQGPYDDHYLAWEEINGKFRMAVIVKKEEKRVFTKPLFEFPCGRRIQVAKHLPEFIESFGKFLSSFVTS